MQNFFLSPSILSANFACLGDDTQKIINAGADFIHFDVMDNHYVPNLTMGAMILQSLRDYNVKIPIDVHLMTTPVDDLIPQFAKAGATYITFHPEATKHVDRTINLIKDYGCKVGLAFNPATPINFLDYVIEKLDLILLMSVNPGFGNQSFLFSTFHKIQEVRKRINTSSCNILLQVDGGVKLENVAKIARFGANTFVIGSGIFQYPDYNIIMKKIRNKLKNITIYDLH